MRKIEIVTVILILIAIFLMTFKIEGALALTVILFFFLSLIYFFAGSILLNGISFRDIFRSVTYSDLGGRRLVWSILSGIVLSLSVLGLVFPVMKWEGAHTIIISVGILLFPVWIISLIYTIRNSKLSRNIFLRATIILFLFIVALMIK